MGFLRYVTAIGTQGAISKETKKHYFVRSYKVDVSSTEDDWITVKDGSKQKVRASSQLTHPLLIKIRISFFPDGGGKSESDVKQLCLSIKIQPDAFKPSESFIT